MECNSLKAERPAPDFLRWLYREGRLTAAELSDQLRALDALAAGKLVPLFPDQASAESKASQGSEAKHSQQNLVRPPGRRPLHAQRS
ncbi:MAG: hypothetical protein DMG39_05480 [Acidobacteria bacterium]|nr:MAG: hypothetical protein DMG39_05480 [Acidobacteriota bacterium]